MATHSSIIAWRILRAEKPSRLRSMGYKESDMTEATAHTHITLNELCMPGGSDCKESGAMQETQVRSLG